MTAELVDTDARAATGARSARSTVTWHYAGRRDRQGLAMAGVDYLQRHGRRRPSAGADRGADGVRHRVVEPGRGVFTCVPDESAYNPIGAIHGGLVCTLLDSVTGCAVHSTLPQGKGYTSVEIKVNYLKAVRLHQRAAHRDRHAW